MSATRLALDLSGTSVRVLEGMPGGPMRCAEAPMPEGAIEDGRITDTPAIGRTLRAMLDVMNVTETRAMIVTSDSLASFRVMTFPKATADAEVDAAVKSQLPVASPRMALRLVDVKGNPDDRTVYAVVWDRARTVALAEAAKEAGLSPVVAELKSLCLARVVPLSSCIVLDITEDTREVFVVDDHLPRLWHTFKTDKDLPLVDELARGLKPVLFYLRRLTGTSLGPDSPILVRSYPQLPTGLREGLAALTGHPIEPFPQPPRVPDTVQHNTYLSCIGLLMRRRA